METPLPDAEVIDLLALTLVPGLGPRLTQALLDRFGSASAARRANANDLEGIPHIGSKLSRAFVEALRNADGQAEVERASQHGVSVLPYTSPDYPTRLKELPDAPHVLYVRGSIIPSDHMAVAIVGSRKCTSYGQRMATRIAAGLARAGYTIVSGLALGIDGSAHRGALEAKGRTIAVLAGGLSSIYPPDHVQLAEEVAGSGALITETPMMMQPQRGMFHTRNRLISGLAQAVVIVEANDRSGALITARHAAEQGRDVFAIPANVDSHFSAGSLRLLRDGAKLIRDVDDLLEDLKGLRTTPSNARRTVPARSVAPPPEATPPLALDPDQQRVWDFLTEPRHVDEITRTMELASGAVSTLLLKMEMKKAIRRAPGGIFERR
ncbi:MAG: DNA-protecting protein DprA [Gemmataceae bacterium]|nr:DNA-protecting protein DprA [Gemmataceae bacterium]